MDLTSKNALLMVMALAGILILAAGCTNPQIADVELADPLPQPEGEEIAAEPDDQGPAADGDEMAWVTDYAEGMREAKEQDKPVVMDLYADWCAPCRALDDSTWSNAEVVALSREFVCIKVDVDQDQETARQYEANAIPLVVFVSPDGKEIDRNTGLVGPERMLPMMHAALDG